MFLHYLTFESDIRIKVRRLGCRRVYFSSAFTMFLPGLANCSKLVCMPVDCSRRDLRLCIVAVWIIYYLSYWIILVRLVRS